MGALKWLAIAWMTWGIAGFAQARISIEPYFSIKSTKSVTPGNSDKTIDGEKVNQRQEAGIRGTLTMWKFLKLQASVGQSTLEKTEKATQVKDEYDEIDLQTELAIDTSDPTVDVSITEKQQVGKFSFLFDPSFSIFIARLKIGVTAQQRTISKSQLGQPDTELTDGPTYKPHSGVGFGIKFSPRMYWMAEYEFYHYKYAPDIEPFERELSVSFGVSI